MVCSFKGLSSVKGGRCDSEKSVRGKFVSFIVTLSMALSMTLVSGVGVSAASYSGEGTESEPYLIATPEDLQNFISDEDLDGTYYSIVSDIGSLDNPVDLNCSKDVFSGTLNGEGHKIYINSSSPLVSDLFGTIKNLSIGGCVGDGSQGGSAATFALNVHDSGLISFCNSSAYINSDIGSGVAVYNEGTIISSSFEGSFNEDIVSTFGGIVYHKSADAYLKYCYTDFDYECDSNNIFGIAAMRDDIVGDENYYNPYEDTKINACYAKTGEVFGAGMRAYEIYAKNQAMVASAIWNENIVSPDEEISLGETKKVIIASGDYVYNFADWDEKNTPFNLALSRQTIESSDPSVLKVDFHAADNIEDDYSYYTITALSEGSATITVTSPSFIDKYGNYYSETVWTQETVIGKSGQTFSGVSRVEKEYGDDDFSVEQTVNSDAELTYRSSDENVVSVGENGIVTINGVGKATITVEASATEEFAKSSKSIEIIISKADRTIEVESELIKKNYGDEPFDLGATISSGAMAYMSTNPSAATVSDDGIVTIESTGSADVIVSSVKDENYEDAESKTVVVKINSDDESNDENDGGTVISDTVSVSGTVNSLNATVTVMDDLGNTYEASSITYGEKNSDGLYGFSAVFDASSFSGDIQKYSVCVSKRVYTKYTVTDIPKSELNGLNIENACIYAGDLNGDGMINNIDRRLFDERCDAVAPEPEDGDLNSDGKINNIDSKILNANKKYASNSVVKSYNSL